MIDKSPLVTVICLCFNHDRFVEEALQSVLNQTHSNIQLIVVDDASMDNSVKTIEEVISKNQVNIRFIKNDKTLGNCKAFNQALIHAKGEFIIDLAADDILLPERIKQGLSTFQEHGDDYGVNFTDAEIIDEKGGHLDHHYQRDKLGSLDIEVPQGNLFKILMKRYIICPPTIMVKSIVYEELSGYDEKLAYEDFDFWIRSSRNWKYCFTNAVLVKKRIVENSMSSKQYIKGSKQMWSTYVVCEKAYQLCRNKAEFRALQQRISYELKHAIWLLNFPLSMRYILLWIKSI
ncbi:MAG: glycosyltransferase [Cyclobacteriaceae bacterium]|nr:glycosyltransferase [Cyclobacteriaceae bacterium]